MKWRINKDKQWVRMVVSVKNEMSMTNSNGAIKTIELNNIKNKAKSVTD